MRDNDAPSGPWNWAFEAEIYRIWLTVDTQSAMLSESLCYVSLCHVCQKYQTRKQSKDRIISGPRQGAEHKANECKQGDKNSC